MVCRAPTNTTTCAGGTLTGAKLSYDNEGRLAAWQDAYTSPTTTASYLYDGEGQRVAQKVTSSGATTTTSYVGTLETVTVSGSSTTTTNYYYAAGKLIAETVNGASTGLAGLTYLVTNYQGSPTEALDRSGVVTASRLYGPYGTVRYSSGAFPTEYGYTGQRSDAATGLDYYGARYYDPLLAQFTSADTVMDGFNRYTYVHGNPTSATDPSGHEWVTEDPTQIGGSAPETGVGIDPFPLLGGIAVLIAIGKGVDYWTAQHNPLLQAQRAQQAQQANASTGPDELDRAGVRFGLNTPDDAPWNARTAPHGPANAPEASNAPTEPAGGNTPATQTGNGGAGAPPTGGTTSVATPDHPDEDDCSCRNIPWSSRSVNAAARSLDSGDTSITVGSRSEAEELFLRKFQGAGYRNATGSDGVGTKQLFGQKAGTYHWDEGLDSDGNLSGHGVDNPHGSMPHLQIHTYEGPIIRIFFPPDSTC